MFQSIPLIESMHLLRYSNIWTEAKTWLARECKVVRFICPQFLFQSQSIYWSLFDPTQQCKQKSKTIQCVERLSLPWLSTSREFHWWWSCWNSKGLTPISDLHRNVRVGCCCLCVGNRIAVNIVVVVVVVCVEETAHETRWLRWLPIHPVSKQHWFWSKNWVKNNCPLVSW